MNIEHTIARCFWCWRWCCSIMLSVTTGIQYWYEIGQEIRKPANRAIYALIPVRLGPIYREEGDIHKTYNTLYNTQCRGRMISGNECDCLGPCRRYTQRHRRWGSGWNSNLESIWRKITRNLNWLIMTHTGKTRTYKDKPSQKGKDIQTQRKTHQWQWVEF